MNEIIYEYLETIDIKAFDAIAVIGSYATNEDKKWSDIDLLFITDKRRNSKIEIFKNKYFVSSYYLNEDFEKYFKDPSLITSNLKSLSKIKTIYDPHGYLDTLKGKADSFIWTSVLKDQSKYKATREFVGYIEEVQKSIQGIKDNHIGKLLNGVYGLSHGMFEVIRLRDQIHLNGENDFYDTIFDSLPDYDPIKELSQYAFGIKKTTLIEQVEAGLEMFMHIGNSMISQFSDDEKEYIIKLIHEIILVV